MLNDKEGNTMKTNQKPQTEHASGKRNTLRNGLALSVAFIGLLLIGALIAFPRLFFKPAAAPMNTAAPTPTDPAPMGAAPSLGPENAPVTIIEYADFGCPACWAWYKMGVIEELRAKYGDQVRFVWRDFPVITLRSPDAAEAGQCAHEQGKFWEFHDLVYERGGAIEATDLKAYADEIGLDMEQFNECVSSGRFRDRVTAETHEAFEHGFVGAPSFLVNDQPLIGPQSLFFFEDLIDPILASEK
jgi:protein-disulfide isomerase